jgi:hypothetical protein
MEDMEENQSYGAPEGANALILPSRQKGNKHNKARINVIPETRDEKRMSKSKERKYRKLEVSLAPSTHLAALRC